MTDVPNEPDIPDLTGAQVPPADPPPMPTYPTTPGPPPTSYGYAPATLEPMTPNEERMWAMLAHLSEIVFAIIAPILILAIFGKRSSFVADQAKEALNFHITLLIAAVVSAILVVVIIGFFMLFAVAIYGLVFAIIGGLAANEGKTYRYPITLRLVK